MTDEQRILIDQHVNTHLRLLREIKDETYRDQWTDEFHELFIDVRQKVKFNLESFLLGPGFNLWDMHKNMTEEQRTMVGEIRQRVNQHFSTFQQENGGEGRFPY